MAFNLDVQLLGLCHFVEEEKGRNPNFRQRLCVLLPDLWSSEDLHPQHQARMIFNPAHLESPGASAFRRVCTRHLAGERVTFRYTYDSGAKASIGISGEFGGTVKLSELVKNPKLSYPNVTGRRPDPNRVAAQILFDRGAISGGGGGPEWRIPRGIGPAVTQPDTRVVPEHVLMQEKGLIRLEVVIERFDAGEEASEKETLFFAPAGGTVTLTFTADCELGEFRLGRRRTITQDEPDRDFVAHYQFIIEEDRKRIREEWLDHRMKQPSPGPGPASANPTSALDYPVPIQVAKKVNVDPIPNSGSPAPPSLLGQGPGGSSMGPVDPKTEAGTGKEPLPQVGPGIGELLDEVLKSQGLPQPPELKEKVKQVLGASQGLKTLLKVSGFLDLVQRSERTVEHLLDAMDDPDIAEVSRKELRKWLWGDTGPLKGGVDGFHSQTGILISRITPAPAVKGGAGSSSDCQNCVGVPATLAALESFFNPAENS